MKFKKSKNFLGYFKLNPVLPAARHTSQGMQ